jgi:archaellum component FlaC
VDPISAMLMLGSALKGIRSCCEMLNEGKAEIQRIKKGVEDAKAIVKDVSGFFGWLKGLFVSEDKQDTNPVQATTKETSKKATDEYIDYIPDEDAIVDQFIKHVGDFFKAQAYLISYKEELEQKVFGSAHGDNNIGALELISIETKLVKCGRELVELMNEAPPQLGPLYSRYKDMYSKILVEQKKTRERERRNEKQKRVDAVKAFNDRIDRCVPHWVILGLVIIFWLSAWQIYRTTTQRSIFGEWSSLPQLALSHYQSQHLST